MSAKEQGRENVGKIVEIKGVVIDAVFPERMPEITNALRISMTDADGKSGRDLIAEVQQHLGDDRVRAVAMDSTDGLARGADAVDTGAPISVPVGDGDAWPALERHRRADRQERPRRGRGALADPPRRARVRRPVAEARGVRDGHEGRRPHRAVRPRRQDRPLRRRGSRQDRADPGAHPQRRDAARRRLRLRRRGGANARGQRPLARDAGVGRHRPRRARLRADERAAGSAAACRALRA